MGAPLGDPALGRWPPNKQTGGEAALGGGSPPRSLLPRPVASLPVGEAGPRERRGGMLRRARTSTQAGPAQWALRCSAETLPESPLLGAKGQKLGVMPGGSAVREVGAGRRTAGAKTAERARGEGAAKAGSQEFGSENGVGW